MTTFAPPLTMPGMRRWGRTFAVAGLVLVAAAPATELAGGPGWAKAVPGLGKYAGGQYCMTQEAPYQTTTTPDTVTVWTVLNGQDIQNGPYRMDDANGVASFREAMSQTVDKIEECWNG